MVNKLLAVSLFSGAGIGDLGFREEGFEFVAMCEKDPDRAALAELAFPNARHFTGDIREFVDPICSFVEARLNGLGRDLDLVSCTAPCQGMSKSGQGTLLNNIRAGKRPKLDPRNRLILPGLDIIKRLRPKWVVFENVTQMRNTVIEDRGGTLRPILDIIKQDLGPDYVGEAFDIEFADYGIPQRRQRLITVYTRDPEAKRLYQSGYKLVPRQTHARTPAGILKPWVTVGEALSAFPKLDSKSARTASCPKMPFHRVPVLDPKKYEWVRHTKPNNSAFDNQCVNPKCGFQGNRRHGSSRGHDGINHASKETPLYCEKCGALLPRPYTELPDGSRRLMRGYTSAYKRMSAHLPAPALTRNLSYPCSDHKLHPFENRVLSLAEAMALQTISEFDYAWGPVVDKSGKRPKIREQAADSVIRLVIGESIPPRFLRLLADHVQRLSGLRPITHDMKADRGPVQASLWR